MAKRLLCHRPSLKVVRGITLEKFLKIRTYSWDFDCKKAFAKKVWKYIYANLCILERFDCNKNCYTGPTLILKPCFRLALCLSCTYCPSLEHLPPPWMTTLTWLQIDFYPPLNTSFCWKLHTLTVLKLSTPLRIATERIQLNFENIFWTTARL